MLDNQLLKLPTYEDPRGCLTVFNDILPFKIKRVYWIYSSDFQERGGHRHHKTRQALVALAGSVSVFMDDGKSQLNFELNEPNLCLLVEPEDWHKMTFGSGSVLLVVASHEYDPHDYIEKRYE